MLMSKTKYKKFISLPCENEMIAAPSSSPSKPSPSSPIVSNNMKMYGVQNNLGLKKYLKKMHIIERK